MLVLIVLVLLAGKVFPVQGMPQAFKGTLSRQGWRVDDIVPGYGQEIESLGRLDDCDDNYRWDFSSFVDFVAPTRTCIRGYVPDADGTCRRSFAMPRMAISRPPKQRRKKTDEHRNDQSKVFTRAGLGHAMHVDRAPESQGLREFGYNTTNGKAEKMTEIAKTLGY